MIDWAYECYKDKKLEKLIENDEEASNDMMRLERLVIVAIWCIQEDHSLRPSMKKVTQMLEGVIEVFVPPNPSLYTSSLPSKISSFIEFSLSTVESHHLGAPTMQILSALGLIPLTVLFSLKEHNSEGKCLYTLKGGHSL